MSLHTETETVIKKILPYLQRRGYDSETDLDFETAINTPDRYEKGYVDILVTAGRSKPVFLIEAKRSSKTLNAKDRDQAISYGTGFKVPFVVVTNGTDIQCFNTVTKKPIQWNGKLTERVPTKDQLAAVLSALKANKNAASISLGEDESLPFRPGLALKQLNGLFGRCHSAIRRIEKDEDNAFADFSKLLFLKLLEEKADSREINLPYSYRIHELGEKPETESDQIRDAILHMIDSIREETPYGEVLEDPLRLKNPKTFRFIVRQLASVSFRDSSLDSKGAAFEYFVRATLKGRKLGQYFTPRPLVEVMLALVGTEKIVNTLMAGSSIKVLDPACGTGGFLIFAMHESLAQLEKRLLDRQITKKTYDDQKRRIMQSALYGSEANRAIACAAKMNMIIAGDGHTNIIAEDSLASAATNWSLEESTCDIILTNPPFGTSESESLSSEDLAAYPVKTAKGQYLFLQKMVLSTVRGGEICTVIDEGVLNTDSAREERQWLFERCQLLAIIRLPEETFKPNKINVKASILFMRRREHDDIDHESDYPVTFCELESLGYAGSGDQLRGFEFNRLRAEIASKLLVASGSKLRKGYQWRAFDVRAQEIQADPSIRLDYKYWEPEVRQRVELLKKRGTSIKDLNLIETKRGDSPQADLYVDEEDGYALVVKAGTNISKLGNLVSGGDFIEKNVYEEMRKVHLKDGDVLLASTGEGTLGKCCVYRSTKPAIADGHVTIIRVDPRRIIPEYLCDYLRAGFGALQIERLFSGSTGLIELTPEQVDSVYVDLLEHTAAQREAYEHLRNAEQDYTKRIQDAEQLAKLATQKFQER